MSSYVATLPLQAPATPAAPLPAGGSTPGAVSATSPESEAASMSLSVHVSSPREAPFAAADAGAGRAMAAGVAGGASVNGHATGRSGAHPKVFVVQIEKPEVSPGVWKAFEGGTVINEALLMADLSYEISGRWDPDRPDNVAGGTIMDGAAGHRRTITDDGEIVVSPGGYHRTNNGGTVPFWRT